MQKKRRKIFKGHIVKNRVFGTRSYTFRGSNGNIKIIIGLETRVRNKLDWLTRIGLIITWTLR